MTPMSNVACLSWVLGILLAHPMLIRFPNSHECPVASGFGNLTNPMHTTTYQSVHLMSTRELEHYVVHLITCTLACQCTCPLVYCIHHTYVNQGVGALTCCSGENAHGSAPPPPLPTLYTSTHLNLNINLPQPTYQALLSHSKPSKNTKSGVQPVCVIFDLDPLSSIGYP